MNVELTIQSMFDNYPGLFKDRADAYNQLFLVLGNGYEWVNGELCTCGHEEPDADEISALQARLVDGMAFQHNQLSLRAEARYYAAMYAKQQSEHETAISRKLDEEYYDSLPDDVYHTRPRKERWYCYDTCTKTVDFCEEYVPLFNVPMDIRPDWAQAIAECRAMLEEDGYVDIPVTKPMRYKEVTDGI